MADVQTQEVVQQAGTAAARRNAWMLPVAIALLVVAALAAVAFMIVVVGDNGEQTAAPATSISDANSKAIGNGAALDIPAGALGEFTPGEAKTDAAIHAISVRSIALQKSLDEQKAFAAAKAMKDESAAAIAVGGHPTGQDEIASGTAAKDEAGVAAAVGNSAP